MSAEKEASFLSRLMLQIREFLIEFTEFFDWIPFLNLARQKRFIAEVYAESLRDNFLTEGLDDGQTAKVLALRQEYDEECAHRFPRLHVFLAIEAKLVLILPPEVAKNKFWAIMDRFERVVPQMTRAHYWSSVPPKGDAQWNDAPFIRDQTRVLLDVIHANYLINTAREASIRRTKIFLLIIFMISTGTLLLWHLLAPEFNSHIGYAILIYAGTLGATMSIIQRLQEAVAHDAMVTDALFELISLRFGQVGTVLSVISGGASALILYFMVMGGLFSAAIPAPVMGSDDISFSFAQMRNKLVAEMAVDALSLAQLQADLAKKRQAPPPGRAGAPNAPADQAQPPAAPAGQNQPSNSAEIAQLQQKVDALAAKQVERQIKLQYLKEEAKGLEIGRDEENKKAKKLAESLGLSSGMDFYRMLIFAFLAGFAERLVPDMLERIRKKMAP
jgi:hypothetical protein